MLGQRIYGNAVLSTQFRYEFKTAHKGYQGMMLDASSRSHGLSTKQTKFQYQVLDQVVG